MAITQATPIENCGKVIFIKRGSIPEINDIEGRIYAALADEPRLKAMEIDTARAVIHDENTLLVEGSGRTLIDYLHYGSDKTLEELRERFELFLEKNVRARAIVNDVIGRTLTPDDQSFLGKYHLQRLCHSMQQLTGREFPEEEVRSHFWAYRLMNALGFYDAQFKESYTNLIGAKLDHYTTKFGQWLSDNTLRNNASPDGKTVVPFDFNSIKFGPMQIDDAAVAGLYLLAGPLAIYCSPPEIDALILKLQEWKGKEPDAEYSQAFLAAAFHENAVIAGYRTKTAQKLIAEIEQKGTVTRNSGFEFRSCFDEIEYHHDVPILISDNLPNALVKTEESAQLSWIADTISHNTFARRSLMMLSPAWGPIMRVTNR